MMSWNKIYLITISILFLIHVIKWCLLMKYQKITAILLISIVIIFSSYSTSISELKSSDSFTKTTFKGVMKAYAFASPDCSYNALNSLLNNASTSIFIELYSFSNPFLLDVLGNLSADGVNIKIILQEKHASYWENQYTYWVAYELYNRGVDVYWASDEFTFTHAKYVIIDNLTVVVMSENWAKSGVPVDPSYGNRGWGIAIENADLADYFLDVFLYDLSIAEPYDPNTVDHGESVSYNVPKGDYVPFKSVKNIIEYMEVTPILSPDFSESLIIELINSANESLLVEQMYIYPDLTNIINALINAKNRGVEIKVLLDPRFSENNETAQILVDAGIDVAFANTSYYGGDHLFETMHNKGMIIDHKITLISSINWSPTSLRENREAGIVIKNENVTKYYEDLFNYDWNHAAEYLHGAPTEETRLIILIIAIIVILVFIMILKKK